MPLPYPGWNWPGVFNPSWEPYMQHPENIGMGYPGYDASGLDPTAYYNDQGATLRGSNTTQQNPWGNSPYLDKGVANLYGYGNLTGGMGGQGVMSGTPGVGGGGGGAITPALAGGTAPGAYTGGISPTGVMTPSAGAGNYTGNTGALGAKLPNWGGVPGIKPLGAPTSQGNIDYSPVSQQELTLQKLFKGSVSGQGGGPIAKMLFALGQGILPPALAEQIMGQTNEQFGKLGARFGTDLATAQARGLAQASEKQALDAIAQSLGLGGTVAGFQFQRGEAGLNRALQEFIAKLQHDNPTQDILTALLQGGLGPSE